MDKTHTAGDRSKEIREQLKITQHQLAELSGYSRNYIAKIESGAQEPAARYLQVLESLRIRLEHNSALKEHSNAFRKSGSRRAGEEPPTHPRHGKMVNPAFTPRPDNPTRPECIAYFEQYVRHAEQVSGGLGHVWIQLQKYFPLREIEALKESTDSPP